MNTGEVDWFTATRLGFAEWLIEALNATFQFLAQLALLIWQDPPMAAFVAGVPLLVLALYGSIRARQRRRAKGALTDERKRGLWTDDVLRVAEYNRRLTR